MSISKDDYSKMTDNASPNSPKLLNCIKAFLFGGGICLFGQILFTIFQNAGLNEKEVSSATSSVLIIITAILTGAGVFDKIARQAGAGTYYRFCKQRCIPRTWMETRRFHSRHGSTNVFNCRPCNSIWHCFIIFIRFNYLYF